MRPGLERDRGTTRRKALRREGQRITDGGMIEDNNNPQNLLHSGGIVDCVDGVGERQREKESKRERERETEKEKKRTRDSKKWSKLDG